MAADYSICLGTAGWGVWHSPDAGESWVRHRAPFPLNSRIQALVAHPREAQTALAGGDTGMFISHDGGVRWDRITAQGDLPTIWSLAIDPVDPNIVFAGTRPAGLLGCSPSKTVGNPASRGDAGAAARSGLQPLRATLEPAEVAREDRGVLLQPRAVRIQPSAGIACDVADLRSAPHHVIGRGTVVL